MTHLLLILSVLLSLASQPVDRTVAWSEDLDTLIRELPAKHKNAFFKCPKETWLARADDIRTRIPTLTDAQIVVELRRLVALLGDAHTLLGIPRDSPTPQPRLYPIAAIHLADGVFTPVLPKEHESLVRHKLVRIGTTPIADVITRVAEVAAADNDSGRRHSTMQNLRDVEVLTTFGFVTDPQRAEFTYAGADGAETTITLAPVAPADFPSVVIQRPDPMFYPAWRALRRFPYGHHLIEDSKTFYIWYDSCANQPDKSVADFTTETLKALDEHLAATPPTVERVIIDFRRNGGGNSILFTPMIQALAERPALRKPGSLSGLIGGRTFSSGMMNAYQLRNATNCKLIGEPTGGGPNGYGEVRTFPLPNSKILIQYSTKLFRGVKEDTDAIYPDLTITPDSNSYFNAQDPVLDAAINQK